MCSDRKSFSETFVEFARGEIDSKEMNKAVERLSEDVLKGYRRQRVKYQDSITVKNLIEILRKYPAEARVLTQDSISGFTRIYGEDVIYDTDEDNEGLVIIG